MKRALLLSLLCLTALLTRTVPLKAATSFYHAIRVNPSKILSTQTDFPVMISGTYDGTGILPDLRTVANGGDVTDAQGDDVLFGTDSACASRLAWEVELYTATTGVVVYWVKIPSLTRTTLIYLCYGDAGITTDQSNKTAVWDASTVARYHLPDGTTLTALNSTSTANLDGTLSGSPAPVAAAGPGSTDGAASFDGANGYIDMGTAAGWGVTGEMTVCAWFLTDVSDAARHVIIGNVDVTTTESPWVFYMGTTGVLAYGHLSPPDPTVSVPGATVLSTATWYHGCFVRSGSAGAWSIQLYLNGAVNGAPGATASNPTGNFTTTIARDGAGPIQYWDGLIDEVSVDSSARSANWIAMQYSNQLTPSTFYTIGTANTTDTYAWKGTFTVTSNSALLPSTQTNYPLLVSVTNNALKSTGNGGQVTDAQCDDVAFYGDSAITTTLLRWELVSCDLTAGTIYAFVQIPSLSLGMTFYAGVGNSEITIFQGGLTGAVWTEANYIAVYHLEEAGTGAAADYVDATGNGYSSTNTANQPTRTASGKVGAAQTLSGSTNVIISDVAAMDTRTTFTSQAWVKLTATTSNQTVTGKHSTTGMFFQTGASSNIVFGFNSGNYVTTNTAPVASGAWQLWTGVFDTGLADHHAVYINATAAGLTNAGTPSGVATTGTTTAAFEIGHNNALGRFLTGDMDEVRTSSVARSANWITVDYNSMNDPGTFVVADFAVNGIGGSESLLMGVGKE